MWAAIVDWVFSIIAWFQNFVGDWGMAIVVVTIIFRLIITPLVQKQNRSSWLMQKTQPRIKELQVRYAGDQQRISSETQRIYKEVGYNPLMGCLPMLLQFPIFIALFQALRSLAERVDPGTVTTFYGILKDLSATPWEVLQNSGFVSAIPYFIFVLIFATSILVPTLLSKTGESQTKIMMGVMAIFMAYIGCISPAGVLVFWDVSSVWQVIAMVVSYKIYDKRDEKVEEVENRAISVEVPRKEKKRRPTKKR